MGLMYSQPLIDVDVLTRRQTSRWSTLLPDRRAEQSDKTLDIDVAARDH